MIRPTDESLELRRDLELRYDGPIPQQYTAPKPVVLTYAEILERQLEGAEVELAWAQSYERPRIELMIRAIKARIAEERQPMNMAAE